MFLNIVYKFVTYERGGRNMVDLTVQEQMELKGGDWVIFTDSGVYTYSTFKTAKAAYYFFVDTGENPSWPGETQNA